MPRIVASGARATHHSFVQAVAYFVPLNCVRLIVFETAGRG